MRLGCLRVWCQMTGWEESGRDWCGRHRPWEQPVFNWHSLHLIHYYSWANRREPYSCLFNEETERGSRDELKETRNLFSREINKFYQQSDGYCSTAWKAVIDIVPAASNQDHLLRWSQFKKQESRKMTDIYICKGVCPVTPLKPHKKARSWETPQKSLILSQIKNLLTTQIKGWPKATWLIRDRNGRQAPTLQYSTFPCRFEAQEISLVTNAGQRSLTHWPIPYSGMTTR